MDFSVAAAYCNQVEVERWPAEPPTVYDWTGILKRCEEIALEHCGTGRWVMVNDADEIRRGLWDLTLADSFAALRPGFNAAAFTVSHFWPIDNGWTPQADPERYFRHYSGDGPEWTHIKAWFQQPGKRVNIHTSGGHTADFPGRYCYPIPFMLKHYPIRSQQHGERKVLRERLARFSPAEIARGWHVHYNQFRTENPNFLRDPKELKEWPR